MVQPDQGYGFIGHDGGDDVFVHFSAIQADGYRRLEKGQQVEFTLEESPKGLQAANVIAIA
jgi:CspA family cold shock protein